MAITLWKAMEKVWTIPPLTSVVNTGAEWVLHLLDGKEEMVRVKILMLLWRIWYVRNEVVHFKPAPPVEASCRFLCSYAESIYTIKFFPQADDIKGKAPASELGNRSYKSDVHLKDAECEKSWAMPPPGWVKLNTDGSFHEESKQGGAGMILRDDRGEIIFSSCRFLENCSSPLEAELAACMEGCALTLQHNTKPCIVEMDCLEAIMMIKTPGEERSAVTFLLKEIKRLMGSGVEYKVEHIKRGQNSVSHALANMGRINANSGVWLYTGPLDIPVLCNEDCKFGV
jgi:ribonuclease HI